MRAGRVQTAPKASAGEQLWIQAAEAMGNGDEKTSEQSLAKLVEAYPNDERVRVLLSYYRYAVHDYDASIAEARTAIRLAPNHAPAYNSLAIALVENAKFPDAEAALRKYVALVPVAMESSNRPYRKALALDPKFPTAHRGNRGELDISGEARRRHRSVE